MIFILLFIVIFIIMYFDIKERKFDLFCNQRMLKKLIVIKKNIVSKVRKSLKILFPLFNERILSILIYIQNEF